MFFTAQVGDLFVSGRSSRRRYIEIFTTLFTTLSWVNFQSRKKLRKFFQKFSFKCSGGWPWRLACDLSQSRKSRVFHKMGQFLNFFNFPSNISACSSPSLPEHSQTHHITLKQTSILNHFILKSSRKKVWVSIFSLYFTFLSVHFLIL